LYFFFFNWLWQCANNLFLFFFTWLGQCAHMLLSFFFFFFNWLWQCVCNETWCKTNSFERGKTKPSSTFCPK
jgi:hypothetical protein